MGPVYAAAAAHCAALGCTAPQAILLSPPRNPALA